MHRQTIIFLLPYKITTVQQKTTNRNNQSHNQSQQTIQNLSIKNTLKQTVKTNTKTISSINRKIYHGKQSHNIRNRQSLFLSY